MLDRLLKARPEALVEAAEILIKHPDAVVNVMTRTAIPIPRPSVASWIGTWPDGVRGEAAAIGQERDKLEIDNLGFSPALPPAATG